MPRITICVSEEEKAIVDALAAKRGVKSVQEYIWTLIIHEHLKLHKDQVNALLLEAINSPSTEMTAQDWKDIVREGLETLAKGMRRSRKSPKKQAGTSRSA